MHRRMLLGRGYEDVPRFAQELRRACQELSVGDADAVLLELCAVEAVNNAIEHAYRGLAVGEVIVELAVAAEVVRVDVRDRGAAMPDEVLAAAQIADPTAELSRLPERGLGLAVIKEAMDDVAYRTEHGVNTLTFQKRLTPADAAGDEAAAAAAALRSAEVA